MKLRTKIISLSGLILIIASILFGIAIFKSNEKSLLDGIDAKLLATATLAKEILPADYHDKITGADSVSEADYKRTVEQWTRLCKQMGLEYIWSLMRIDGKIVFTSATPKSKDVSKGDYARFFETHGTPELYTASFESMKPRYQINDNMWGRTRVMLLPFKDARGRPFLFGASMKTIEVDALLRKTIWQTLGISAGILFFSVLVSVFFSVSLVRPLEKLKDLAGSITKGNWGDVIEPSGATEIKSLALSVNEMSRSIEEKIAERNRAETALRESEEQYRSLFMNSNETIFVAQDGNLVFINPMTTRMIGYSDEDILSRSFVEFIHPEDRDMVIDRHVRRMKGEELPQIYSFRIIRGDGKIRWVELNTVAVKWKGMPATLNFLNDITEREQIEKELRETKERYDYTTMVGKVGTWDWDVPAGNLVWNAETFRLLGLAPGSVVPSYELFLGLVHQDDRRFLDDSVKASWYEKQPYSLDCRIVQENGQEIVCHITGKVEFDSNNQPARMLGTIQDITDRKRAEEALRESEERFRTLSDKTPLGMSLIGIDNRYEYLNPAFVKMFGYDLSDIPTGKEWFKAAYPDPEYRRTVKATWKEDISAFTELEVRPRIYEVRCKGGDFKTILFRSVALLNRKQLIIYEDITEGKRLEDELRKSEERYRSHYNNTPAMLHSIDTNGNIISVSEYWLSILGYNREEVIGRKSSEFLTEASRRYAVETVLPEFRKAGYCSNIEYQFVKKNGEVIDTLLSAISEQDEHGMMVRSLAVITDITERKRAEQETAALANIGRVIGSTLDIDQVYERFAAEAKKLIPFDRITVYLHSLHEGTVIVAYVSGEEIPGRHRGDSFHLKNSISEVLIKTREGLLDYPKTVEEVHQKFHDHNTTTLDAVLPSLARVPLIYRNEVIGALLFGSKTPNAYTKEDLHLAERIGAQIAGAIGNAQLFNDLGKTEKSLRESEERLQRSEKMEALGQLAGGVAHDLNNVLGIMSGYSELLLEEIPEGSQSRGHVEKILNSTKKGAAIIEDLLTLARRGVTTSAVINLSLIVPDFLQTPVFEKIKEHHPRVTFRTDCDDNLLNIKGSPVHLEKTLMNLVSNAAEAISGEGEVTIRTESRYLANLSKPTTRSRRGIMPS